MSYPEYLEDGFEPKNYTIPKLRAALEEERVVIPPGTKKKDQFIALFNEQITSRAGELRIGYETASDVSAERRLVDQSTWSNIVVAMRPRVAQSGSNGLASAREEEEQEEVMVVKTEVGEGEGEDSSWGSGRRVGESGVVLGEEEEDDDDEDDEDEEDDEEEDELLRIVEVEKMVAGLLAGFEEESVRGAHMEEELRALRG